MKILVTGSEGNIGQVLVPYLRSRGHDVFGIDYQQRFKDNFKTIDINNGTDLLEVFHDFNPDIVFHLAAMVSRVTCETASATTVKTNLYGTENIIKCCKWIKAKLIFFSTSEVYGNIGGILSEDRTDLQPNNFYGLSKLMGEQLVKYEIKNGLDAIIVRPFMFYHESEAFGDNRSAMIRFVYDLIKGQKIIVHKGSRRSWMHLDDGVKALEKLCYVEGFQLLNIGSDYVVGIEDLAELICNQLNYNYENWVNESPLPDKMTLTKIPDLRLQYYLTGVHANVKLGEGIKRVINNVKSRI